MLKCCTRSTHWTGAPKPVERSRRNVLHKPVERREISTRASYALADAEEHQIAVRRLACRGNAGSRPWMGRDLPCVAMDGLRTAGRHSLDMRGAVGRMWWL